MPGVAQLKSRLRVICTFDNSHQQTDTIQRANTPARINTMHHPNKHTKVLYLWVAMFWCVRYWCFDVTTVTVASVVTVIVEQWRLRWLGVADSDDRGWQTTVTDTSKTGKKGHHTRLWSCNNVVVTSCSMKGQTYCCWRSLILTKIVGATHNYFRMSRGITSTQLQDFSSLNLPVKSSCHSPNIPNMDTVYSTVRFLLRYLTLLDE